MVLVDCEKQALTVSQGMAGGGLHGEGAPGHEQLESLLFCPHCLSLCLTHETRKTALASSYTSFLLQ